jgi:hypothetical protein
MWTEGIENRNGQRIQWTAASIDMLGRVLAHEKYHHAAMETFRAWKSEPNGARKAQLRDNLDRQTRLFLDSFAAGEYYVVAERIGGKVIAYGSRMPAVKTSWFGIDVYMSDGRKLEAAR